MPESSEPVPAEVEQDQAVEVEPVDPITAARERHNQRRGPVNPARELRESDALRNREVRNAVAAARSAAATAQASELAQAFSNGAGAWWAGGIDAANNAAEADRVRARERAEFLAGGWRDREFGGAA